MRRDRRDSDRERPERGGRPQRGQEEFREATAGESASSLISLLTLLDLVKVSVGLLGEFHTTYGPFKITVVHLTCVELRLNFTTVHSIPAFQRKPPPDRD